MASLSLHVRSARKDNSGFAPVRLRISHRGERRFISLDLKVKPEMWGESTQQVTKSHPGYATINRHLSQLWVSAQEALIQVTASGQLVTAQRVKEAIQSAIGKGEEAADFLAFCSQYVRQYLERDQIGTYKSYRAVLRKFRSFCNSLGYRRLHFGDVDAELMEQFETYMYSQCGNSMNTVGKGLKVMRTLCRAAIRQDYMAVNPFRAITIRSEPTQKNKLDLSELEKLERLKLETGSKEWHALGWFLFSCYAGGMRFSDVATLKHKHIVDGRIRYRMRKNSNVAGLKLIEKARLVLGRYSGRPSESEDLVFPILDGQVFNKLSKYRLDNAVEEHNAIGVANAEVNELLKSVQQRAGIGTPLTFHLARHSSVWKMWDHTRDLNKVMRWSGHSSIKQVQTYLSGFDDGRLDDDVEDAFA